MTAALRPYPEYRDSDLPWLARIPSHWSDRRAKYLLREVDERSLTGAEELLSVSHLTGVTPRRQKSVTMFMAESYVGHKLCRPGDLVVNTMWAWMAALGVAKHAGIVSPAYAVYRPRVTDDCIPDFMDQLLRTHAYASEYFCRSTGIRPSRLRLYPEKFLEIPIVQPPVDEQRRIASFIRHLHHQFGTYIRAKRHLIDLLNEQKQAIIHRAVTGGLDPNARLKPSGIDWLGHVPEHWEVSRVKDELACLNSQRVPLSGPERGKMRIRAYDYYGASGIIDRVDDYLFDAALILLAEDGANLVLRNLPLAIIARGKFWVNNHAHILKPKRGSLEYFASVLECIDYRPWITGAAQPKLTKDRLMAIAIPVPAVEEQERIVAWVAATTSPLRTAVQRAGSDIDLAREYRTRLIAEAVTGKLDVREVPLAAGDEAGPIDEMDAVEKDEDALDPDEDTNADE